jgi:hypothetical protein
MDKGSSATARLVAGQVARGRWPDGQDFVQPGDRQGTASQPPGPVQDEPTAGSMQVIINAVKHCQPGGAQELQPGEIEYDLRVAIPAQLIEYLLQIGGAE